MANSFSRLEDRVIFTESSTGRSYCGDSGRRHACAGSCASYLRAMQAVEAGLDPIDAMRPGNQGAAPVALGIIQLEFGYVFERDSDQGNSVSVHSIPDLLLILGVSERFDLRFWATGLVRQKATRDATCHGSVNGIRDVTIGSLIRLTDQTGGLPAIGIQPSIVDLGVGLTERLGLWVEHSTGYSTATSPGWGRKPRSG